METRAYRSKLGRLPHTVRSELNERLRDGATCEAIIAWLGTLPEYHAVIKALGGAPVNAQNITQWRSTGYKAWLAEQAKTRHLRAIAELANGMAAQVGGDPTAIGARLLAGRLLDCMEEARPEDIGALAASVAALRRGENDAAKIRLAADKVEHERQRLELDRERFRFQVASRALEIFEDRQAQEIATSSGSRDERIRNLLSYMESKEKGES
jgi:hypothetical protein